MEKKKFLFFVLAFFIFCLGIFVQDAFAPEFRPPAPQPQPGDQIRGNVMVPDLTGLREGVEVAKTLDKKGLRVGDITYEAAPSGWQNRVVLRQDPPAGRLVPEGTQINLVITLVSPGGAREVVVPDVRGRTGSEARTILERAGLLVGEIRSARPGRSNPYNVVDNQEPVAGRRVPVGSRVNLVLSTDVLMPNLINLNETRARSIIEREAGLRMGRVNYEAVPAGRPTGVVTRQSPESGRRVSRETEVSLTIAEEAIVPNLRDKTEAQARALLLERGLSVGEVTYREMPNYYSEGVISQSPAAGTIARRGNIVNFEVGVFIPREIIFKFIGVFDDTDPTGSGEIWVRAKVNGTEYMILRDDSIDSGEERNINNYTISVSPYSFPPPDNYMAIEVEARDDDTFLDSANPFRVPSGVISGMVFAYESLGTASIRFSRYGGWINDSSGRRLLTNMYGKGTNAIFASKFKIVFEIR